MKENAMNALTAGAKKRLALHGPDRVIVDINGTAVSQFRAKTEFSTEADVILIRADGWMLGAPWKLLNYARSIWKDQWVEEIIINADTRPKKKAPDAAQQPPSPTTAPVDPTPAPSPAQPASAAQDGAKPEEHAPVSTPKPAPPKKAPTSKVVKEVLQVGNPPDNPGELKP
jgi:hypothetical protein